METMTIISPARSDKMNGTFLRPIDAAIAAKIMASGRQKVNQV